MTTCAPSDAPELARKLLEERLVACAQVLPPMTSMYWWEGAIATDSESLILLKTTEERVEALRERLMEIHPYQTPEFVTLPVESASASYLDWLRSETDSTKQ